MKKYIKFITIAVFAVFTYSCVDDLDQTPVSSITDDSFWQNEEDARGALAGMHSKLRSIMDFEYFQWGDMRGEAYTYGFEVTHGSGYQYSFENRLNDENTGPQFDGLYNAIAEANAILEFVPGMEFNSEDEKSAMIGMAYGVRAYSYFMLARVWGDVPLVAEHISSFDDITALQIPRSPVADVYALIDSDIENGLSYMTSTAANDKYYMSRPALLAIKAEVSLTKATVLGVDIAVNAQAALDAISECFGTGETSLKPNYASIFDVNNERNQEVIWSMPFDIDETGSKPLASRMYISYDKFMQIAQVNGVDAASNKEETFITFESGSLVDGEAQTGNSYNAWDGAYTLNGAWIGPETSGAIGWDNDGGGNSLKNNVVESPFDSVGEGYARVNPGATVLIKLPETMSDIDYIGTLAKAVGNASTYTDLERTLTFEVSTDQGGSWEEVGSVVIDNKYKEYTTLHQIDFTPVAKADGAIWVRLFTGGAKIHILDNIRLLGSDYVYTPAKNDVNPGNNSTSFNYLTFKPEICNVFLAENDPRAAATFMSLVDTDGTDMGGIAFKYRGDFDDASGNRNYTSDVILYRAGELKLMEAEAQLLLGNADLAINAITEVRDRAGVATELPADVDLVTQFLVKEYLLETMGEGKRWFQMMRFGGSNTVKTILETYAPDMYSYGTMPLYSPLSRSIMTRNPSLVQTEGY